MKLTSFKNKTRKGPDYRHGEQVSFKDIQQTFELGNIRIGNWVTREEKALAANLIFDSFADLAYMLALPPQAIGLRGHLNLAFGSGGQKGVQAHYAPHQRELALAKNAGAGALAHEFWHAFDHYIADKAFHVDAASARKTTFASDCWLMNQSPQVHPLNERLLRIFEAALLSEDKSDKHEYVTRSVSADQVIGKSYFSLPTEMMARAFEATIESCTNIRNPYLVFGTTTSDMVSVYPDMAHRREIYNALLAYFQPLGDALNR